MDQEKLILVQLLVSPKMPEHETVAPALELASSSGADVLIDGLRWYVSMLVTDKAEEVVTDVVVFLIRLFLETGVMGEEDLHEPGSWAQAASSVPGYGCPVALGGLSLVPLELAALHLARVFGQRETFWLGTPQVKANVSYDSKRAWVGLEFDVIHDSSWRAQGIDLHVTMTYLRRRGSEKAVEVVGHMQRNASTKLA